MRKYSTFLLGVILAAFSSSLFAIEAPTYSAEGKASYYGLPHQGKLTANGEIFNMSKLTAAHKTLPFGTRVQVTNLKNGKTVTVRINDRGPYAKGRIIDLSEEAAAELDMVQDGVAPVRIKQLSSKR